MKPKSPGAKSMRGSSARQSTRAPRRPTQARVLGAGSPETMGRDRLDLLYLTLFPPSPPACGAQRRIDGLMRALSRRHDITAITLLPEGHDGSAAERAMREYCREIALVPAPPGQGPRKRLLQLRSLLSIHSFERHNSDSRWLLNVLDSFLSKPAFDIVEAEFPFLSPRGLRK